MLRTSSHPGFPSPGCPRQLPHSTYKTSASPRYPTSSSWTTTKSPLKSSPKSCDDLNPSCHIDFAGNGAEAVDLCKSHEYSVVFMNLSMPVLDGYDATQILRNLGMEVPIIAASTDTLNAESPVDLGFNEYVPKPFNTSILRNVLLKLQFELHG
ncbi:CheY-like superfamily [Chytridium lagenaria]|nr:CheY-like superfamily [Chytridium lagenaria]